MTIDAMKNIGIWPSGFAGCGGLTGGFSCTRPRSTFDNASVVISSTTPEIRNGSRAS